MAAFSRTVTSPRIRSSVPDDDKGAGEAAQSGAKVGIQFPPTNALDFDSKPGNVYADMLTITAGAAKLVLAPKLGGAIARLDLADKPILRPWNDDEGTGPFTMASNILVPFSNRIAGGAFKYKGQLYTLPNNLPGEPVPIHGDGFQKPWLQTSDDTLTLENGNIGPFRYRASQRFDLKPDGLHVELRITNTGDIPLPFGGGFHPWFPHSKDTRLSFNARHVLISDTSKIPDVKQRITHGDNWDYSSPSPLPESAVDNCWEGWQGPATITQGPSFVSVKISASDNMNCAIVYRPKNANFLCFEPVSHPINAHNAPEQTGLAHLEPEDSTSLHMCLQWDLHSSDRHL